jgi:hypothetical protein
VGWIWQWFQWLEWHSRMTSKTWPENNLQFPPFYLGFFPLRKLSSHDVRKLRFYREVPIARNQTEFFCHQSAQSCHPSKWAILEWDPQVLSKNDCSSDNTLTKTL